jgi:hypothetical protein
LLHRGRADVYALTLAKAVAIWNRNPPFIMIN